MPETNRPDNTNVADDITSKSADFEFAALPPVNETAPDYTRRLRFLAGSIIFAGLAYTSGWYWLGNKVVAATQTAISDAALNGQTIICAKPTAKGYPFRLGLSCSQTSFEDPAQGIKIEAGAFRSAAQIYEPTRIIGELDGPFTASGANFNPFTLNWDSARASLNGVTGLPQRLSVEIQNPVFAQSSAPNVKLGQAALAGLYMRQGENNQIDLASKLDGLKIKEGPVFNFASDAAVSGATRFDAALKNKTQIIKVLRGSDGELRNLNLTFIKGGSLAISGPFSISTAGLLSGTFKIEAENAGALIDNIQELAQGFGITLDNLGTLKAMAISDTINLSISIKDGNASIGFIPLGLIPPL